MVCNGRFAIHAKNVNGRPISRVPINPVPGLPDPSFLIEGERPKKAFSPSLACESLFHRSDSKRGEPGNPTTVPNTIWPSLNLNFINGDLNRFTAWSLLR